MRKKLQRYIVFGLTGLLVLAIAFFSVYLLLRSDEIPYALALEAEFLPTGADLTGVDLSSGFLFVFPGKVKAAAVRQYLTVEPRLELGFHQGRNNREVIISLTEPLKEDKIYTFQLLAEGKILQWAFASKKDFTALGSFPADKSTGVPLDSTISISFSLGNNQGGDEYFQIEPQVEGYFSYAGAVVTFNPRDELTPATIYTVTAREGWPLADSDQVLPQEYSFQFETTDKEPTWEFVDILTSFLPEEEPSLALDLQESRLAEQKAQVRLEKYSDIEDMAEELHKAALEPEWTVYASRRQKPENCSLVASYEIAVENEEGRLWSLALPESLPKGFYLLRVTLGGVERWVRFQVSPINGYVYCQNGGVEIWLHESPGGKPLSDNYEVWDSQTGIINSHIGELGHGSVFVEYTGTAAWLIRAGGPLGEWLAYLPQDEYKPDIWQYLYLDRTAYGHQSTVNYWGFYRPSFLTLDEESLLIYKEVPQSANLILQNRTGDTLYRSDVSINGSTYSGSFDLPNLPAGIYNLSLFVGDKPVSIARLQVADPLEYQGKLSLEPEQPAVFAGDKLTLSFKAEDLLGLPLAGQQVKYTIFAEEYTVTLDDRGEAVVAVQVPFWGNTDISQADITAFLSAETGLALRADSTVTVLNSRIILKSSYRVYPEPALFWLEFYSIDAEAPDHIGEPLAGETVALQIYDHTSEGEAVPLGEETDLTTGESGLTVFDFPAGPLDEGIIRRTARIDFSDTAGRQYQKEIYLYGTGPESGISFEVNGNSANYSATLKSANPNSLSLPGSFLFKNHAVRKHDPTINGGWEQPESQNADVWGIYFNGKQYWPSPRHTLELAPNLHLTCSQDKKEYSPLSHASLKFTVSDQEGRGREARILLSIAGADQARDISLLEDQLPDEAGFIDRETLFFSELKTDKDGVAALELDLPEESGLWQMTVLALDESFNMGQQNSFYWAQGQFILEIDSSGEEEGSDPHLEPEENPLLLNLSQNQPLENGKPDFPDSSSLLWLVFSGPERCRLLSSLWQEAGALGNSLDQRLGAVVARQLLAEAGDWGISLRPIEDFSAYQQEDGGLALLPGLPGDLELSVKSAAVGGDFFCAEALENYFALIWRQGGRQHYLALAGLAALGSPVLQEIKYLLSQEDLEPQEELILLWALLQGGDRQNARQGFLEFRQKNHQGIDNSSVWLALLYADCGLAEDYFLFEEGLSPLERVLADRALLSILNNNNFFFSYSLAGQSHDLNLTQDYFLFLAQKEINQISFSGVGRGIMVAALYNRSPQSLEENGRELNREYVSAGGKKDLIAGEAVEIHLNYNLPADLPEGIYEIIDVLPAGLQALAPGQGQEQLLTWQKSSRTVSFSLYKEASQRLEGSLSYYAWIITPGTYTAPGACLLNGTNLIAVTDEEQVDLLGSRN